MVLPMAWVDLPKFFCGFSETLTDVVNALVPTLPWYGTITKTLETGPGLSHTLDSLTQIDYYIDYMITALQGGPEEQR